MYLLAFYSCNVDAAFSLYINSFRNNTSGCFVEMKGTQQSVTKMAPLKMRIQTFWTTTLCKSLYGLAAPACLKMKILCSWNDRMTLKVIKSECKKENCSNNSIYELSGFLCSCIPNIHHSELFIDPPLGGKVQVSVCVFCLTGLADNIC